jgi:PKD repeat protein
VAAILICLLFVAGVWADDVFYQNTNTSVSGNSAIPNEIETGTDNNGTISEYVKDELIVQYITGGMEDNQSYKTIAEILNSNLGSIIIAEGESFGMPGLQLVKLGGNLTVESAIQYYISNTSVLYAEPNYISTISPPPSNPNAPNLKYFASRIQNTWVNDEKFPQQWGLTKIQADKAWDICTGSDGVVIALIDTGIDYSHPDIAGNIWRNPGEIPNNGIDDDGDGYIDDLIGWNFVKKNNLPFDDHSHGTHCAGIIAALTNNHIGVAGTLWKAKIIPLKTFDSSGSGDSWRETEAIKYADKIGAKIISCSWSEVDSTPLKNAILNSPALFIFAAGNGDRLTGMPVNTDVSPIYPSCYDFPNIISVAAIDPSDNLVMIPGYWASNYGKSSVDLAAPGYEIYSTLPGNSYGLKNGTSMATPFVAGVAGLIKSKQPELTNSQIKAAILNNVDKVPSLNGKVASGGRLNAYKALISVILPLSPPASVTNLGNTTFQPTIITWTWTDPTSTDFSKVMVYLDGKFQTNVTKGIQTYTAASLTAGTQHTIATRTVGTTGLVNLAWVNSTARTAPVWPVPQVVNFIGTPKSGTAPLTVQFTDSTTNSPTGWAWYFGDENYQVPWTQVTASAPWVARATQSCVVMPDGSIVLMGGGHENTNLNDVWRSTDNGITWTQMTAHASWSPRNTMSGVVVPDGSIILMGGYDGSFRNDVWRSTDNGATWAQMTSNAGWAGRYEQNCVVLTDGSIVIIGGETSSQYKNDVWRSTDKGATWTQMTSNAGWAPRLRHTSIAMPDGSIILMGGQIGRYVYSNEVWRSVDKGATWTKVNASPGWAPRASLRSLVMPDGSILLAGGQAVTGGQTIPYFNDVWRSTDNGATWIQLTANAPWMARAWHSIVGMPDGSALLIGGGAVDGQYKADVWRFMPTGSSVQNPSHTYSKPGIYSVALQAYKSSGYSSIRKIGYITVTSSGVAPVANFTTNKISGFSPLSIQFSDTSTGTLPLTYQWNFGDGTNSSSQSPVHTYTATVDTTYTITLTTSNSAGSSSKLSVITVYTTPVIIPPASITSLINTTYQPTSITWTWTDPTSTDFSNVMVYLDGIFKANVTKGVRTYTASSLIPDTEYTIETRTVGTTGLINQTWVSATARTAQNAPSFGSAFIQSTPPGAKIYLDYTDTGFVTPKTLSNLVSGSHIIRCSLNGYDDTTQTVSISSGQTTSVMITLQKSGNVAPKADFSASTREGGSPLTVQFIDKSTNSPTFWTWTFGDGSTSNEQNPRHIYLKSGIYSVKLKVSNPVGTNGLSRSGYIVVSNSGPTPTITPTTQPTTVPTTIVTTVPTTLPTTVTTTVITTIPTTQPTTVPTTGIPTNPPKADFSASVTTGTLPLTVQFTDKSSNSPTSWIWTFGDGSTSNEQNPSHTYLKAGIYSVKLKVSNSDGSSGLSRSSYIIVSNVPVPAATT